MDPDIHIGHDQRRKLDELAGPNGASASDLANRAIDELYARCAKKFGFFDNPSLDEVVAAQGVKPIANIADLAGDFWPADETADDFREARRRWRAEEEAE